MGVGTEVEAEAVGGGEGRKEEGRGGREEEGSSGKSSGGMFLAHAIRVICISPEGEGEEG